MRSRAKACPVAVVVDTTTAHPSPSAASNSVTRRVAATASPTDTAWTQTTSRPAAAARNPFGTTPSRPANPARYRPLVAIRSSQYGAPRTRAASNSELYTIITVAFPRFTLCASEDDNQLGHEVPPIPSHSAPGSNYNLPLRGNFLCRRHEQRQTQKSPARKAREPVCRIRCPPQRAGQRRRRALRRPQRLRLLSPPLHPARLHPHPRHLHQRRRHRALARRRPHAVHLDQQRQNPRRHRRRHPAPSLLHQSRRRPQIPSSAPSAPRHRPRQARRQTDHARRGRLRLQKHDCQRAQHPRRLPLLRRPPAQRLPPQRRRALRQDGEHTSRQRRQQEAALRLQHPLRQMARDPTTRRQINNRETLVSVCFRSSLLKPVISTEAAHSVIVSRVVEKSASTHTLALSTKWVPIFATAPSSLRWVKRHSIHSDLLYLQLQCLSFWLSSRRDLLLLLLLLLRLLLRLQLPLLVLLVVIPQGSAVAVACS